MTVQDSIIEATSLKDDPIDDNTSNKLDILCSRVLEIKRDILRENTIDYEPIVDLESIRENQERAIVPICESTVEASRPNEE